MASLDSTIVRVVDNIKKSDSDSWNYRGLELSNEMLVVLISHPNIDKAAAALDVSVGNLADSRDVPGTAHFLEHMLFMGSSKYPGENEYSKLIEGNGGYKNAFTSGDHTNYRFDINPNLLPEALDVESLRTTPKQRSIDIRQVLLDFHKAEYSSNRMSLAVLGNQSLDELQSLVMKSFNDVPNKKLKPAKYPSDPYGESRWEEIIYIIYQYIAMLRKEGPNEWIFNECKNLEAMYFQFREKEPANDFVSNLAGRMRNYPLTECLSGDYEMREFRPDLIIEELNEYLIPSKMRVFLQSKKFTSIATEKEKWFGTQYKQEYLPEELIKRCETCELIPELHLPIPNKFIPTDFHLFSKEQHSARPQLPIKIKENEFCRLFYGEDTFYRLPKAYLYFELRNSLGCADPLHSSMNALYAGLVKDSLTEIVYPAQLGGLHYELFDLKYGIQLTVYGFNHKIKQLLETIIDCMVNIKVDPQRFEILKEKLKASLKSFPERDPWEMAHYGLKYLTAEHQWNYGELLSCIDNITVHNLDSFITQMLTRFFTDSLMYGNLTEDHALEYMNLFVQKFQEKHFYQLLFPGMWFNQRELTLPEGYCNYAYKMLNDAHKIYAIEIYLQCFQQTLENTALLELFCHLVHERCYDQLRTKEQLGYSVSSGAHRSLGGIQGFSVAVQSPKNLDHVNQRIELFIDSIRDYISNMPDHVFKKQREGYVVKKVEIPKGMYDQVHKFWYEITSHQFCFDRPQLEVEIIKSLERTDLLHFYDHYISLNSIHRRKLSVHVNSSATALQRIDDEEPIIDEETELAAVLDEELPSPTDEENTEKIIEGAVEHTVKLTEQSPIIDTITDKDSKEKENIISEKQINLPKEEWIDNVYVWKSKMPCYPLAQSYENIDIPVLHRL
ncbi:unnamed protein product [Adineta steineri]|uniref:Insulin-degrading enzyme n=1 Tax=Adineta steineri TaxID=433720 RepID=A0A814IZV7_9BILA|nr:unnamed protein product [Adineta steineri]CAF1030758.1 unnamed protein product [Adineta steineri]